MNKPVAFIILLCLSGAFFCTIIAPQMGLRKTRAAAATAKPARKPDAVDAERVEACARLANEYLTQERFKHTGAEVDTLCHYNKKRKAYFLYVSSSARSKFDKSVTERRYLVDCATKKECGSYEHHIPADGDRSKAIPRWTAFGRSGTGEKGWDEAIGPYLYD